MDEHPEIWWGKQLWFDRTRSMGHPPRRGIPAGRAAQLGGWRRHSETALDFNSPTYQDMMFFHPFIRRAFFDTGDGDPEHHALIRRYVIHAAPGSRLYYEAEDDSGESARVEVTDLRLLLFANGVAILRLASKLTT